MKPFDIELWKAGEPVIMRNEQKVEQLTKFDLGNKFMLVGVVNETFLWWEIDGSYLKNNGQSNFDLFHPEPEMWVNLYEKKDRIYTGVYTNRKKKQKNLQKWN